MFLTIDKTINNGKDPYVFRLCGRTYHRLGSLVPEDGKPTKFAQFYIYDGEDKVQRLSSFPNDKDIDDNVVRTLICLIVKTNLLRYSGGLRSVSKKSIISLLV